MKLDKLRVSLAFGRGKKLLENARAVLANLFGNASFATPPVTAALLAAAIDQLATAIALQAQGGTAATAEKNNREAELTALLEKLAFYVQVESANDPAKLLSSGFYQVSTNRVQIQLPQPTGLRLTHGQSGQSLLTVDRIPTARCFEIQVALLGDDGKPGPWMSAGLPTVSRNMPVDNLIGGRLYIFQVRAVGGSTGYSDWSDPISHRAL